MTYTVFYRCSNCFFVCRIEIPKGKEAPIYFECPECGLINLFKSEKRYSVMVPKYVLKNEFEIEAAK